MKKQYNVIIDFDDTIAPSDEHGEPKEPFAGTVEALGRMRKNGMRVIIHSGRTAGYILDSEGYIVDKDRDIKMEKEIKKLHDYLKKYKIPYDAIWKPDKAVGIAYIDDKGIGFKGNWQSAFDAVLAKFKKEKEKEKKEN